MSKPQMRGLTRDQEVDAKRLRREFRTVSEIVGDTLAEAPTTIQIACTILIPIFFYSPTLFALFVGPLIVWLTSHPLNKNRTLPLVLPAEANMRDPHDPKPGRIMDSKARGRIFLGNTRFTRRAHELWLAFVHALQHSLVIGSTGAGKTETLVSMAANYIAAGSGTMYSDAKAVSKLAWQIYTLARFFGREDDFRVLNYIKGNTSEKPDPAERQANTVNLFAYGSAQSNTQIIVSIMPPSGGENKVFGERAIGLIHAIMPALVDLRDRAGFLITPNVIRKSLEMEEVEKLKRHPRITRKSRESLRSFLASLPGYKEDPGIDPRTKQKKSQPEEVGKQFGFAQQYFTRALASLSDTYDNIYMVGHGEINFLDMVYRRRIGVVMIPALENAPEELKNLSKIVLAAQKNAVSTGLPPNIEGRKEEILDNLPTNAPSPYCIINDEFAFMMVPGYGTLMAQARGLSCAFIIAGQDYAGMRREDEAEAEQIAENTKIKIIMASEGLGATADLVKQVAGEGIAMTTQGFSREGGAMSNTYADSQSASFERQSRVDTMDTRAQIEGEGILMWRDKIVPFNSFFHGLDEEKGIIKEFRVNRLVSVNPPTRGYGYDRLHNESKEQSALRQAVKRGTNITSNDIALGDDLGFLHDALNRRRDALANGESQKSADGTFYGSIVASLDSYLVQSETTSSTQAEPTQNPEPEHDGEVHDASSTMATSARDRSAPPAKRPTRPAPSIEPEIESSHSASIADLEGESAPDDWEDELPEPAPPSTNTQAAVETRSKVAEKSAAELPKSLENSSANRVLTHAPWVVDPSLIDDVAGRSLRDSEKELSTNAANAVARIEAAAGTEEDQSHATGITTANAVARNVNYPSNSRARMPELTDENERKAVVDRTAQIFQNWMNAADSESDDESPRW
ncbi:hypothetical protein EZI54_07215 [Marinobacter halodurans]|uniref:TraD/TraG TraM recognition site domain-containing protein n=1 Tax=Marinobacter halodurans TaxID=2528979 RepID=A0ABY1ZRJ6_9GAMM|nr:type IV secretory system conjugative DNA transfer family protein [Marinobacter halodurans]TBW57441.1 hypothetical protein EZI54_07215 [Marinobacter halodurans]